VAQQPEVEGLVNAGQDPLIAAYRGRRVLVTGHTGFKGSWLVLWLQALGADVSGLALEPATTPNHWSLLDLNLPDHRCDLRDAEALAGYLRVARPEIIFHLGAQSLVRRGYREPVATWSANVMGTAHLLDACRDLDGLRAIVVATTDKVYENLEREAGYREHESLGGHDPYSASKAATELLVASWRRSFLAGSGVLVATVRAGNVIGGGDWSEDRLIPDVVRAVVAHRPLAVRSPDATRPWQHVLDALSGYLLLGAQLLAGVADRARAWNFGPEATDNRRVGEVLDALHALWPAFSWTHDARDQPHEAGLLHLDSGAARAQLGWQPLWRLDTALRATADWYRAFLERGIVSSREQLAAYRAASLRARAAA
jgi:CDP-glucose 4,6-dehydratase